MTATASPPVRGAHDSPRWCETCQTFGSHHTDRHHLFFAAPEASASAEAPAPPTPRQRRRLLRYLRRLVG